MFSKMHFSLVLTQRSLFFSRRGHFNLTLKAQKTIRMVISAPINKLLSKNNKKYFCVRKRLFSVCESLLYNCSNTIEQLFNQR